MDEVELIGEITDRHRDHLVYAGSYQLLGGQASAQAFKNVFDDWRQRIYRFENDLGASVVFYRSLGAQRMTWDLVVAKFIGEEPFDFRYADAVNANLRWREVQQWLDRIKLKTL